MATDGISTSSLVHLLFLVATNAHKSEDYLKDSDLVQPDFFYALKMNKPPWFVAHRKGIFYECAFGYVIDGKQWWSAFFSVQSDAKDCEKCGGKRNAVTTLSVTRDALCAKARRLQ
jgi:hypothetical protein